MEEKEEIIIGADALRLEAMLADLRLEFPKFRIMPKSESILMRAIDLGLKIVTLGRQDKFLTRYATMLGYTLYVPAEWDLRHPRDRVITLRHERVHMRQCRRLTLPVMALVYISFPPIGLAYGRARLEWEAYKETLTAVYELDGETALLDLDMRSRIIGQFTGAAYLWMWPFPKMVDSWYDDAVTQLLSCG